MMNQHVIDFYQHQGTQLTQKYIRSTICFEEFTTGVLMYQDKLKKESRAEVGDILNLDKDCECWDPMFNGLKGDKS